MTNVNLQHIHQEVLMIKQDVELIKNILSEEGKLSEEAKQKLAKARLTPLSEYTKLDELD